jgi:predicted esterase
LRLVRLSSRVATVAAAAALILSTAIAGDADAAPTNNKSKIHRSPKPSGPLAWCAEELETLPNGLCHIEGGQKDGRRTLVVFLHGMIARDVDWQWLQERALTRQAKQNKFDAVFARAPLGPGGYVWPGSISAQETSEQELIDGWRSARKFLESRSGKPYDEVFLMGFSSGAYFVSALALRGRVDFDGYAVFAGGAGGQAAPNVETKAPVYVGVCADDRQTANHSRSFGGVLAARGWPHRVDEQHVGHMFADVHVGHAVTYLRAQRDAAKGKSAE